MFPVSRSALSPREPAAARGRAALAECCSRQEASGIPVGKEAGDETVSHADGSRPFRLRELVVARLWLRWWGKNVNNVSVSGEGNNVQGMTINGNDWKI